MSWAWQSVREALTALVLSAATASVWPAATVEGIVLEQDQGRPLARARVILQSVGGPSADATRRAISDQFGRFSFSRLPAGYYLLGAEKSGYAPVRQGQSRWNGPGRAVHVEAEARFHSELRLPKLGVLTGDVIDENRVGIPDYPVLAYHDGKPLRLAGQAVTDDRGVFRIAGLEPGRYRVRTGPKQLEDGSQFLPTWFGQSADAGESQAVVARLDEETAEIRLTPLPGRLLRLSGKVTWVAHSIALYSELGKLSAAIAGDGSFSLSGLAPGRYELIAESNGGPAPMSAYRELYLAQDIEGIVLEASPAPKLHFECLSRRGSDLDDRSLYAVLRRVAPAGDTALRRIGCYRETTLSPGTWEVLVSGSRSAIVDFFEVSGRPAAANEFRAMPGESILLDAIVSTKPASLRGVATTSDGQPAIGAVVLLHAPDKELRWRITGRDATYTNDKGEFKLEGLPAGTFRVLATYDYEKPEQVEWSVVEGTSVRLAEGEEAVVNLSL